MSNLCGYSNTYILVQETTSVPSIVAQGANPDNRNKMTIFKNCTIPKVK